MRLHTEPQTDWKNIFQLWKENGEKLPFNVAKSTWSADAGHYLVRSGRMVRLGGVTIGMERPDRRKRSRQPELTTGSG
jgi:hypothetical protein